MFKIVFLFGLVLVAVMAQVPEKIPQPPMQGPPKLPGPGRIRLVRQANLPMPPGGMPNPSDMMSSATNIMHQGKDMAENAMGKMTDMAGGGRHRRQV